MTITVEIPSVLQPCVDGASEIHLRAKTISAVLAQIEASYPELYRCVCDETGSVRQHVNLFLNHSMVCDDNTLDASLTHGDVIAIFQAVSGG